MYKTHEVRYCYPTNETKGNIMSDTMWYERTQAATKECADAHRLPWDSESIETVIAFTDTVTDEEIAYATGRTLKAIQDIQWRMRHEGVDMLRAAYAPKAERVAPTCDTHHIALAANGACDWC